MNPVLLLVIFLFSALQNEIRAENRMDQLIGYFTANNYYGIFILNAGEPADSIWEIRENRTVIDSILLQHTAAPRVLFICAEVKFYKTNWKPSPAECKWLAPLYAKALKENFTKVGNPWGLPDDHGDIGEHVLLMGDDAVMAFKPLLRCRTPLTYIGSRDATTGKMYAFRVKDIAANYISELKGLDFEVDKSPRKRDKLIRDLKKKI